MDEEMVKWYTSAVHEAGLSERQAQALISGYVDQTNSRSQHHNDVLQGQRNAAETELKKSGEMLTISVLAMLRRFSEILAPMSWRMYSWRMGACLETTLRLFACLRRLVSFVGKNWGGYGLGGKDKRHSGA